MGAFLAILLVAYLGQFGPLATPVLGHQLDLLVMFLVAVGAFFWAVRSGGPTDEIAQVVAHQEAERVAPKK